MRLAETNDVTELLRSLPDMQPPADAWAHVRAKQRPVAWAGAAVAACAALVAVVIGITDTARHETPVAPVETYLVQTDTAPTVQVAEQIDVNELRRRSQRMERMLYGLPPRTQLVRADVAGAIAELQDRIAAVDYELNRSTRQRRAPTNFTNTTTTWPSANRATSQDLWRERVDLMDRLVRVRYAEAGAEAY